MLSTVIILKLKCVVFYVFINLYNSTVYCSTATKFPPKIFYLLLVLLPAFA